MNIKKLTALVESMGGTVEETKINPSAGYDIVCIAPDNKQWVDGNCVHMVGVYYPDVMGDRADAINYLYERVSEGLEDYDEELNGEQD